MKKDYLSPTMVVIPIIEELLSYIQPLVISLKVPKLIAWMMKTRSMRWTLQLLPVSQLNIHQSYLEITEIMNYIVKTFIYATITLGLVACSQEDINSTEHRKQKKKLLSPLMLTLDKNVEDMVNAKQMTNVWDV